MLQRNNNLLYKILLQTFTREYFLVMSNKGFPCVINAYCREKNCKCGEFTHLFIYMQGSNGVSYPFLLV